ncbi:uncharacterized protein [Diadema antillarum]|uniref:uncharacterized protein n=1 Tax=Diadema antillarum TaxID=105358 RepID=UPI003A87FFE6
MDGFTAIPVSTMGREHMVVSYPAGSRSQISFVAVEDATLVTINLNTAWVHTGIRLNPGENLRFNLNRLETIHLEGATDPTGSMITSNKPISVLTGSQCAFVPNSVQSCDHLVEQIAPFHQWGRTFIASAMMGRQASTVYRLLAGRDNTVIAFSDPNRADVMLSRGRFIEFDIGQSDTVLIQTSMPCLLVAFAKGHYADNQTGPGDPSMTMVPPLEQGVHSVHFLTYNQTQNGNVLSSFLNVLGECLSLENATIDGSKAEFVAGNSFRRIGMSRYCALRLPIRQGAHNLVVNRHYAPVVGFLYGFASFNSYAFPVAMATDPLTCYTTRPDREQVEHFCVERVVIVGAGSGDSGPEAGDPECDYSECVHPVHVILIAVATAAGALIIEFYMRRKFSQRRKERERRRRRSLMKNAAAAISSLSFYRERRPALTGVPPEET